MAFIGKIECKKYLKAVWNSMSSKQQMQRRKVSEHQCVRTAALEAQLGVNSQPREGDDKKKNGDNLK